jgi:hypothetical protein
LPVIFTGLFDIEGMNATTNDGPFGVVNRDNL